LTKRDVLSATDLSREELENLLDLATCWTWPPA
jgi:ornithine carbamoyltransferase